MVAGGGGVFPAGGGGVLTGDLAAVPAGGGGDFAAGGGVFVAVWAGFAPVAGVEGALVAVLVSAGFPVDLAPLASFGAYWAGGVVVDAAGGGVWDVPFTFLGLPKSN